MLSIFDLEADTEDLRQRFVETGGRSKFPGQCHFLLFIYNMNSSILEANNLSGFTCSQLKRDFASGRIIPQLSAIPDIDDIRIFYSFPCDQAWIGIYYNLLQLMLGLVKTFRAIGMRWMSLECEKDIIWGRPEEGLNYVPFKIYKLKS